jgi:transducin (beta)-like 1
MVRSSTVDQTRHPPESSSLPVPWRFEPITVPALLFCVLWCILSLGNLLASGSADATAVIWKLRDSDYSTHFLLDRATQQKRDGDGIATLAWNPSGTLMATGCYDGTARIWIPCGELKFVLHLARAPFLASASRLTAPPCSPDRPTQLAPSGTQRQVHRYRYSPTSNAESSTSTGSTISFFAAASSDAHVCVFRTGQPYANLSLGGHGRDVNKGQWGPSPKMLPSCSGDGTVRIWRSFESVGVVVLQEHTKEVYSIRWAPRQQRLLVSLSFDQTTSV